MRPIALVLCLLFAPGCTALLAAGPRGTRTQATCQMQKWAPLVDLAFGLALMGFASLDAGGGPEEGHEFGKAMASGAMGFGTSALLGLYGMGEDCSELPY